MFKYHIALLGNLLKPSEYQHIRRGKLAKSLYNFYSGLESLIHSSSCSTVFFWGEEI